MKEPQTWFLCFLPLIKVLNLKKNHQHFWGNFWRSKWPASFFSPDAHVHFKSWFSPTQWREQLWPWHIQMCILNVDSHPVTGTYLGEKRRKTLNATQKTAWHFLFPNQGDSQVGWLLVGFSGTKQTFSKWICVSLDCTPVRQRPLFQCKSAERVLLKHR